MTPAADLVDAKSGEVVAKAGEKITAKRARELAEDGLKEVLFSADDLAGRYLAEDIVNLRDRRRSTARPATSSTPSCWRR